MNYETALTIETFKFYQGKKAMNMIERELLKTAKKLFYHAMMEEIEKIKDDIEKAKANKYYFDVLNSGILLDVQKIKSIGIEKLYAALKKRELKP